VNPQIVATAEPTSAAAEVLVLPAAAQVPDRESAPLPASLIAGIAEHQANSRAHNTTRAYRSDWEGFERWCDAHDQVALPASAETVAAFLTDRAAVLKPSGDYAYSPTTLARWLTSINARHRAAGHREPGRMPMVATTMSGIRRGHARPTRRMAPLLLADLKKVLTTIDSTSYPQGIIGTRDAAILMMGFAGAFRRSELASRVLGDITLHPEDGLHVRLLTSKTDQEGRGSVKGLPFGSNPLTCAPCSFLRWVRVLDAAAFESRGAMMRLLRESSIDTHICQAPAPQLQRLDPKLPLFRTVRRGGHIGTAFLSGSAINDVVKRRLEAAGMDPTRFGGHSLRAGFVTQALRAGASPSEVARQTFHRNLNTVLIYQRESTPLRQNAVTRLGL